MPDTLTTWHDAKSAEQQWPEPPQTAELSALLEAAREQCEAYAPALAEGEPVPERYRLAQLFQAKALWQSQRTGVGDTVDAAGQTVRVYPMDWQVKQLLRPSAGVPLIG